LPILNATCWEIKLTLNPVQITLIKIYKTGKTDKHKKTFIKVTRVNSRNGFPIDESTIKIAGADKITLMTWQGALMTTT